jgi:hypothetical protein
LNFPWFFDTKLGHFGSKSWQPTFFSFFGFWRLVLSSLKSRNWKMNKINFWT